MTSSKTTLSEASPDQQIPRQRIPSSRIPGPRILHSSWYTAFLLLIYTAMLLVLLNAHEVWRDEVRALSLATAADSISTLLKSLHNEGHPALWYLVLRALHSLIPYTWVLKLASALIAISTTALFLWYSPFNRLQKTLWVFGFYPLYEYAVYARNYGIGVLLVFTYCVAATVRNGAGSEVAHRKAVAKGIPIVLRILSLVLLPHTSLYGCILAAALLLGDTAQCIRLQRMNQRRNTWHTQVLICVLTLSSIFLALYGMYPDSSTEVTTIGALTVSRLYTAVIESVRSMGSIAHNSIGVPFPFIPPLLLAILSVLLWPMWDVLLILFFATLGIELTHRLVYSAAALRHQGFFFITLVVAYWLAFARLRHSTSVETNRGAFFRLAYSRKILSTIVTVLLVLQVYSATKAVYAELRESKSSAAELATLIANEQLHSAILIGEPYFVLETLPYYLPNRIYFARESQFGQVVSFTSKSKKELSLSELLETAERLQIEYRSPVLLLLPETIKEVGSYEMMYGRSFDYDANGLTRLKRRTTLLAEFHQANGDENYSVYRFLP